MNQVFRILRLDSFIHQLTYIDMFSPSVMYVCRNSSLFVLTRGCRGHAYRHTAYRHTAYNHTSAKEAVAKRNESKARDPVKDIKAKYQLEPLLMMPVVADVCKAIMAKI